MAEIKIDVPKKLLDELLVRYRTSATEAIRKALEDALKKAKVNKITTITPEDVTQAIDKYFIRVSQEARDILERKFVELSGYVEENKVKQLEKRIEKLEKKIKEEKANLAKKDLEKLKKELTQEYISEFKVLKKELQEVKERIKSLQTFSKEEIGKIVEGKLEELNSLRIEIEKIKRDFDYLHDLTKKKIDEVIAENSIAKAKLREEIEQLKNKIEKTSNSLREKIFSLSKALPGFKGGIMKVLNRQEEEIASLTAEVAELHKKLTEREEKIENLLKSVLNGFEELEQKVAKVEKNDSQIRKKELELILLALEITKERLAKEKG